MTDTPNWLMLSMQLPAHPAYTRVKLWRQLRQAGAVTLAGGLHCLPDTPPHRNTLERLTRDAAHSGGQATLVSGTLVIGPDAPSDLVKSARASDYETWLQDVELQLRADVKPADVARMRRRLDRIRAIEFFDAGFAVQTDKAIQALVEASFRHPKVGRDNPGQPFRMKELHGRTWVTRRHLGVDRIASAWLIRRFIDPRPRFRFVDPDRYVHQRRELRFDMTEGEFTHEGDRCTFETLLHRTEIPADRGLREIGMMVHQLDIEDDRFDRAGTGEFSTMITKLCAQHEQDDDRFEHGLLKLDEIYRALIAMCP